MAEVDPCENTSFDCATELTLGESVTDNFNGSDRQYFSYTLEQAGPVLVDIWPVPSDQLMRLNMYTEEDQEYHAWSTYYLINDQPGQRVAGNITAPAGKYFVELRSNYPAEDYTITVTDQEDQYEWNQTCVHAAEISLGDTIEAKIIGQTIRDFEADDDYYTFTIPEDGVYKINFAEVPQIEKQMIYRLYKGLGCGSDIGWWANNAGFPFSQNHSLQAGIYYIMVELSGNWGSSTPYKFVISKE